MRTTLAAAAALTLAGCASTDLGPEIADAAAFATEAAKRGVVIGDGLSRDEWAGYLAAAAAVYGDRVPEVMEPWITEVCVASAVIETPLDPEAAALCAVLAE